METGSAVAGRLGCPKRMVFGPCGGVRDDERCELTEDRCVFLGQPLVPWPDPPSPRAAPVAGGLLARAARGPVVLADLSVAPFDHASVRRVVDVLAPVADALLAGEHANKPDFPPTVVADEVMSAGGRLWTTLACRDRNRVVLEQELAGLAALGVDGVLCVTGDGRGPGVRPGVTQVFDLDGVRLAALAARMGLAVAVPESPEAPPVDLRPARVAQKERAGAQLCVLNHVSSPTRVAEFVAAARAAGATLPFVAGVAVYTDEASARVLQRFPGLHLDDAVVERVLSSADPRAAGIAAAVEEARALLAVPGVVGVNLSGMGSSRGEDDGARIKAAVAEQLRESMTGLESEAMEAEFDTVAGWTEEAVRALGPEYAVPAGCRGSGSEGALRWLADRLALAPGTRMLDDGAGVGGPAGWLAAERGLRPVCAEPMVAAVHASRRLFGLPSVVAVSQQLPFPDGSFDAAWCLGVLCTTSDKAGALAELRRTLTDGARLGLLVFVADAPLPPPLPEGNEFPSEPELLRLLADAGFRVEATADADLSDSPEDWTRRADAVDAEIARRHGSDPAFLQAEEQSGRVGRLLSDGALRPWLGVAIA